MLTRLTSLFSTRLPIWREIAWRPALVLAATPWAAMGAYNLLKSEFMPTALQERYQLRNLSPWPWWIWALLSLAILVIVILESAYRIIKKRSAENATEVSNLREQLRVTDRLLEDANQSHTQTVQSEARKHNDWFFANEECKRLTTELSAANDLLNEKVKENELLLNDLNHEKRNKNKPYVVVHVEWEKETASHIQGVYTTKNRALKLKNTGQATAFNICIRSIEGEEGAVANFAKLPQLEVGQEKEPHPTIDYTGNVSPVFVHDFERFFKKYLLPSRPMSEWVKDAENGDTWNPEFSAFVEVLFEDQNGECFATRNELVYNRMFNSLNVREIKPVKC